MYFISLCWGVLLYILLLGCLLKEQNLAAFHLLDFFWFFINGQMIMIEIFCCPVICPGINVRGSNISSLTRLFHSAHYFACPLIISLVILFFSIQRRIKMGDFIIDTTKIHMIIIINSGPVRLNTNSFLT